MNRQASSGLGTVLVLIVATAVGSAEVVKEGDVRILRMRACGDEEVRERPEWKGEIREYLAFASDIYERTFGIRFQLAEIVEWESYDEGEGLGDLVDELEKEIPLDGVDVVIGFSAQTPRRGKLSKYVALPWGLTPSLGRASMIRAMMDDETYDLHLAVVHEIGHLFGAFHVRQQDSVMRETVQGPRTFQFDVANGKLIRLMRDYDFEAGVEGVSPETAERLTWTWRQGAQGIDSNPLAEALLNRGVELHQAERGDEAIALWRRAVRVDETFAAGYASLGLALAARGKYDEALENLRKADELGWPEAKQALWSVESRAKAEGSN